MIPNYEQERDTARRIIFYGLIGIVLALILLATCAGQPASAAGRPPTKRACIGVVVRTTEGIEFVRRKDGTACTRPATVKPQPVARRGR